MKESGRDMRLGRAMTPLWEEKWAFDPWYDSATFYSSPMMAGIYSFGMDKIRFGYGRIRENRDYKYTAGYNMGFSKRTNLYIDVYREILESKNNHMNGIAVGMNHSF